MTQNVPQVVHSPDLPDRARVRNDSNTGRFTPLLTTAEAAEFLAVSETLVYRLVERGELAVHRVSRRLRFSRDDLTRYLLRRRADARTDS